MFSGRTAEALFRLDDYQHAQLAVNQRALVAFAPTTGLLIWRACGFAGIGLTTPTTTSTCQRSPPPVTFW